MGKWCGWAWERGGSGVVSVSWGRVGDEWDVPVWVLATDGASLLEALVCWLLKGRRRRKPSGRSTGF